MDDFRLPNGVVPLGVQRRRERTPNWPKCSDHVPSPVKEAFEHFNFSREWELGVWDESSLNALSNLLQNPIVVPVFDHLENFSLDKKVWPQLLIDCLVEPYRYVRQGEQDQEYADKNELREYYSEVSEAAYKLYNLLSQEGPPANSPLSNLLTDLPLTRELMKVVSLSTSATWPTLYYQWMRDADKRYYDCDSEERHRRLTAGIKPNDLLDAPSWDVVEKKRIAEMPWLYEDNSSASNFPPPPIPQSTELTAAYPEQRFIKKAVERLDQLSERCGREFVDIRNKGKRVAHANSYIFLNAKQWRAICFVLFGGDPTDESRFQEPTINKLLREHYKDLPSQKVRK